jgi:hypothetical protein
MADLVIRIKKKTDGAAALSCIRRDGSTTWQRQEGQLGRFFPLHDLTHYAVETVLGFQRAFYGLLAEGWDISDFGTTATRGKIPDEAGLAESVVGFFDLERMTGERTTVDEMNERLQTERADRGLPPTSFRLTQEHVDRVRTLRADLFARWKAVPPGEALELSFERAVGSAMSSEDTNATTPTYE